MKNHLRNVLDIQRWVYWNRQRLSSPQVNDEEGNKVDLTRELIGCRDVWENVEWKGLPTLDMGLAVLQTAQNLKKPFNLKIRHDYIKIEKIWP